MATNEFQRDIGDVQKKFEPQSTQLKQLSAEVDTLDQASTGAGQQSLRRGARQPRQGD